MQARPHSRTPFARAANGVVAFNEWLPVLEASMTHDPEVGRRVPFNTSYSRPPHDMALFKSRNDTQ
jgi:hypothetical protein